MRFFICILIAAETLFQGCAPSLPTKAPVDAIYYEYPDHREKQCLVIFLPGRGGDIKDFEKEGFIRTAREHGLSAGMVSVNMHFGYYEDRTIVTRLKQDVIEPAKARGHKHFWLVGTSMGGLGALLYTREHTEDVAGLFLIAPFLGEQSVIKEITEAGGLNKWEPVNIGKDDYQRGLWQWLKLYTMTGQGLPPLYLAYGLDDRFASAHKLLAQRLPETQVFTTGGGHDWSTWRPLWERFIKPLKQSGCK